jgi:hypothetical protein
MDDSTLVDTTKAVGPLSYNTKTYWRVNAKNDGGQSQWSGVWNFTTSAAPAPPPAPVLVSPLNAAANQGTILTLTWNASSGATGYRLQVSTNSGFSSIFLDDSTLTTTARQVSNLTGGAQYWWRVNAKNASGTGPWSSSWSFKTKKVGRARLATNALNFGPVAAGTSKRDSFELYNVGDSSLTLLGIMSSNAVFSANQKNITLLPGDSMLVWAVASPSTSQDVTGFLYLNYDSGLPPDTVSAHVDSTSGVLAVDPGRNGQPLTYKLDQNYPNPFNPTTTIGFDLAEPGAVVLTVYNILGQEVVRLAGGAMPAGHQSVVWNAKDYLNNDVPSGVYMYRLQATSLLSGKEVFTQVRKMTLMK